MKKIHFEDHQQDLLWIIVDKNGLIIECNLQNFVWCGMTVYFPKLAVGEMVWLDSSTKSRLNGDINRYNFVVKKIENLKDMGTNQPSTSTIDQPS